MKEEGKIDKLIRDSFKKETPSKDFTNNIMGQIMELDAKKDKALSSVLKRNAIESPSVNFTDRLMATIEVSSSRLVNKPIIGKKMWAFIGFSVAMVVMYVLTMPSGDSATSLYLGRASTKISDAISIDWSAIMVSPLFAISVFALSALLFLDYFLRSKSLSVKI